MALPNAYVDVSTLSMNPAVTGAPEYYIELWWYSGGSMGFGGSNQNSTVAGSWFLSKGTVACTNSSAGSAVKLHTLNTNWNSNMKYALEVAINSASSGYTAYAQLYDITSSTLVSGSQISTTSTTTSVLRSSQFTLTPGHSYGITVYVSSSSSSGMYLTDASLIVFSS